MRTPSSLARRMVARWISLNSSIRRRRWSGIASTSPRSWNSSSPAQIVGTTNVPARAIRRNASRRRRCSARCCRRRLHGVHDALAAWACAATGLKLSCATFDGGAELLEAVLDGAGVLGLRRQHRPRGHHLDDVSAVGELATHGPPHGVGAVGHLVHAGVVVHRRGRHREQPACQEQPRPGDSPVMASRRPSPRSSIHRRPVLGARVSTWCAAAAVNSATAASAAAAAAGSGTFVGWVRWTWQSMSPAGPSSRQDRPPCRRHPRSLRDHCRDAIAVHPDVGSDEPLARRLQHPATRQPTHRSIRPDRGVPTEPVLRDTYLPVDSTLRSEQRAPGTATH